MRKHYEHLQSSGLGKKVYATQAGISVSTFYYWVSKLEKQSAAPAAEGFQTVQLDLAPSDRSNSDCPLPWWSEY